MGNKIYYIFYIILIQIVFFQLDCQARAPTRPVLCPPLTIDFSKDMHGICVASPIWEFDENTLSVDKVDHGEWRVRYKIHGWLKEPKRATHDHFFRHFNVSSFLSLKNSAESVYRSAKEAVLIAEIFVAEDGKYQVGNVYSINNAVKAIDQVLKNEREAIKSIKQLHDIDDNTKRSEKLLEFVKQKNGSVGVLHVIELLSMCWVQVGDKSRGSLEQAMDLLLDRSSGPKYVNTYVHNNWQLRVCRGFLKPRTK